MDIVKGMVLKDYFMSHVKKTENKNFYEVVKPLYVFKKTITTGDTFRSCITNLIIPKGTIIYCCANVFDYFNQRSDRKMRASRAIVHSSVRIADTNKTDNTWSLQDATFIYKNGKTVNPRFGFSMKNSHCESGIHFFLNLQDAIDYY